MIPNDYTSVKKNKKIQIEQQIEELKEISCRKEE